MPQTSSRHNVQGNSNNKGKINRPQPINATTLPVSQSQIDDLSFYCSTLSVNLGSEAVVVNHAGNGVPVCLVDHPSSRENSSSEEFESIGSMNISSPTELSSCYSNHQVSPSSSLCSSPGPIDVPVIVLEDSDHHHQEEQGEDSGSSIDVINSSIPSTPTSSTSTSSSDSLPSPRSTSPSSAAISSAHSSSSSSLNNIVNTQPDNSNTNDLKNNPKTESPNNNNSTNAKHANSNMGTSKPTEKQITTTTTTPATAQKPNTIQPDPSLPYGVLSYNETMRLCGILSSIIPIDAKPVHGMSINAPLALVIQQAREELIAAGFVLSSVRLNGGAAVACLDEAQDEKSTYPSFKDLDIIFFIEGKRAHYNNQANRSKNNRTSAAARNSLPVPLGARDWDYIRDTILRCLGKLANISQPVGPDQLRVLSDTYVEKLVRVKNEHDCWSLISFANHRGRNIELKFVEYARRQYEFSVDSFQIELDTLLDVMTSVGIGNIYQALTLKHFPKVQIESVYGDYQQAKCHVSQQLITTHLPEQIRGGGLLRYCNLLVRGFKTPSCTNSKQLERLMCSRFFIDFIDLEAQQSTIDRYLTNHFIGEEELKFDFLIKLRTVLEGSSICLMGMERRDIIEAVTLTAYNVLCTHGARDGMISHHHHQHHQAAAAYNNLPRFTRNNMKNNRITNKYFNNGRKNNKVHHHNAHHRHHHHHTPTRAAIAAATGAVTNYLKAKKAKEDAEAKLRACNTAAQLQKVVPNVTSTPKTTAVTDGKTGGGGKKTKGVNGTSSGYASEETTSTHTDFVCSSSLNNNNSSSVMVTTSVATLSSSCSSSLSSNSSTTSNKQVNGIQNTAQPTTTPKTPTQKIAPVQKTLKKSSTDSGINGQQVSSPQLIQKSKQKNKQQQNKNHQQKSKNKTYPSSPPTQNISHTRHNHYHHHQQHFACDHGCHLVHQSVIWALREITKQQCELEPHCFIELHSYKAMANSSEYSSSMIMNMVSALVSSEIVRILKSINHPTQQQQQHQQQKNVQTSTTAAAAAGTATTSSSSSPTTTTTKTNNINNQPGGSTISMPTATIATTHQNQQQQQQQPQNTHLHPQSSNCNHLGLIQQQTTNNYHRNQYTPTSLYQQFQPAAAINNSNFPPLQSTDINQRQYNYYNNKL